jgi:arginyl-tRNA synthetase
MRENIKKAVSEALNQCVESGLLPEGKIPADLQVSRPKHEQHGDFATNAAMILASELRMPPRKIAEALKERLEANDLFSRVDVAGPGFINFFIKPEWWRNNLLTIVEKGDRYGTGSTGGGQRVLIEFVSANPTGPLHVGHGRGAAVGDSLARVMRAAGYDVETEYYINDVGNQMKTLGTSVYLRYQQHFGRDVEFPQECYQGDYIKEIASDIAHREGDRFLDTPVDECVDYFTAAAVDVISASIRHDLENFRVSFDNWFSERTLHQGGLVQETIDRLQEQGLIYEKDDALWFRSSDYGDEKDRVVRRANGILTYFAADIAYHREKLERGYDMLVDIWGADHHGYIPRVKAVIRALGFEESKLQVLLVQLVNLLEGGRLRQMSTRAGQFVTLKEVLDDVGVDAARFMFLTRKCDSHLDFDLDLAKSQSQDNPVYYVQYAHARLCSVFRNAESQGMTLGDISTVDTSRLEAPEEIKIMKVLAEFPLVVSGAADALEPHRVSYYLTELASLLHSYYTKYRFIEDDPELGRARLLLAQAVKNVFAVGLDLLGVSAPEKM